MRPARHTPAPPMSSFSRWAFTLLSTAALASCRASEPRLSPTLLASDLSTELDAGALRLGPNDVLRVGVYGHPELTAPPHANVAAGTRVDAEGNLSLPLVGPVHVADMTVLEAHEAIRTAYGRFLVDPKIDVSVIEYASRRFYLLGEVEKAGAYPIDRPLTLYQALALGGGLGSKADRDQIVLLRGDPSNLQVAVFDAEHPMRSGFAAIQPDDLIFVRRTNAGKFSDEILPYLVGISSSLSSVATVILIGDSLDE